MTRLEYLFEQCMNGTCSPEEKEEMMALLSHEDNEAEARELINIRLGKEDTHSLSRDSSQAILQAIFQAEEETQPRKKHYWYRYAAAAAVLLLAGYFCTRRRYLFCSARGEIRFRKRYQHGGTCGKWSGSCITGLLPEAFSKRSKTDSYAICGCEY